MKKAISLIELVFAIVIIGIAAMSFPLILTQTSDNIKMALQQEAILNAKAYIGIILSHPWDTSSTTSPDIYGGRAMVLDTTRSTADNEFDTTTHERTGHIEGYGRRLMLVNNTGNLVRPEGVNIGNFNNAVENLRVAATVATDLDYILNFSLTPTISFVSDQANYAQQDISFVFNIRPAGGTTNIKMINMQALSVADGINIVLRAYSSNIGEYFLLERSVW